MTDTDFNSYYQDDEAPEVAVHFGVESLFDGLVEIFVPYGQPTEKVLDLEEQFK